MIKKYLNFVTSILSEIVENQEDKLREISELIAKKIVSGGKFYVMGTGHSHMVGEEFYARAGGLGCVNMIAPLEFTLSEHPTKSTAIERISAYADVVFTQYKITKDDVIMICSNSGRNGLPIEVAKRCGDIGATVIALTNLKHSSAVTSRHESGKRLFEIADYVIDNCGVKGDAYIDLDGVKGKMGASSTVAGTFIAQVMGIMIAEELVKLNFEPPVFVSSNLDVGDRWNEGIMKKYYGI